MYTSLRNHINKSVNFSDKELDEIEVFFQSRSYPKKTLLLKEGEICKFEAFILKGCIKTYFINNDGFEVILTFATENWWVSDIISFQDQNPSKMYIETLEDTDVILIIPSKKEELLAKFPSLERMFRLMLQRHLASYQERLFGSIALTAEERYHNFLNKFPELPQRIPQHQIASYLGISPEFLSRLRTRKLK